MSVGIPEAATILTAAIVLISVVWITLYGPRRGLASSSTERTESDPILHAGETGESGSRVCHSCSEELIRSKRFCLNCGVYLPDPSGEVENVTFNRRFFGDNWLEGILFVLTLGIGWFIWLAFAARTAQSPAKSLLNVYTLDADSGLPISAGRVWLREVPVKFLFSLLFPIALVDACWVLADFDRQALHDKVVNTIVVYAPDGLPEDMQTWSSQSHERPAVGDTTVRDLGQELRELARLRDDGLITSEEYETKRAELVRRM